MRLLVDGAAHDVEIVRERDGGYVAIKGEREYRLGIVQLDDGSLRFRVDGLTETVRFQRAGDRLYFLRGGETLAVRDLTRAAPERAIANGGDGKVRAAMNGRVVAVLVKQGDRVEPGQPVITLEAMSESSVDGSGDVTAPIDKSRFPTGPGRPASATHAVRLGYCP